MDRLHDVSSHISRGKVFIEMCSPIRFNVTVKFPCYFFPDAGCSHIWRGTDRPISSRISNSTNEILFLQIKPRPSRPTFSGSRVEKTKVFLSFCEMEVDAAIS